MPVLNILINFYATVRITLPRGILGRTDEMLKIKGVKFWPSQIGNILREFSECTGKYQGIVSAEKGVDRFELMVEGNERDHKTDESAKRLKQETLLSFDRIEIMKKLEQGPLVVDRREGRTF